MLAHVGHRSGEGWIATLGHRLDRLAQAPVVVRPRDVGRPDPGGRHHFFFLTGSERAYATPRLTHVDSARFWLTSGGIDAEPSVHRAAAHHHRLRRGRRHELVGLLGIDAHEDAALAARGDRHVAADQEGEAAEHLLLREALLAGHQLADPVGEVFVVGHRSCTSGLDPLEGTVPSRSDKRKVPPGEGSSGALGRLDPCSIVPSYG